MTNEWRPIYRGERTAKRFPNARTFSMSVPSNSIFDVPICYIDAAVISPDDFHLRAVCGKSLNYAYGICATGTRFPADVTCTDCLDAR